MKDHVAATRAVSTVCPLLRKDIGQMCVWRGGRVSSASVIIQRFALSVGLWMQAPVANRQLVIQVLVASRWISAGTPGLCLRNGRRLAGQIGLVLVPRAVARDVHLSILAWASAHICAVLGCQSLHCCVVRAFLFVCAEEVVHVSFAAARAFCKACVQSC